jgi:hypothetical protein
MKKLILLCLVAFHANASDIKQIRDVLKHVESNMNLLAIGDGGKSFGVLQIQKGVIEDVNRRYGTDYVHEDAFNEACADEIFQLYTAMYAEVLAKKEKRPVTEMDIVKLWNGGPNGYKLKLNDYVKKYLKYKNKVSKNKRQCLVNGQLGMVTSTYNNTMDVYLFKERRTMYGVSKDYVTLLPKPPEKDDLQYKLKL